MVKRKKQGNNPPAGIFLPDKFRDASDNDDYPADDQKRGEGKISLTASFVLQHPGKKQNAGREKLPLPFF